MKKKNILVISFCAPYDSVGHAGGKTHNFYLKKMNEEPSLHLHLLSFAMEADRKRIDLISYGIHNHIFYIQNGLYKRFKRGFINLTTKYNPYDKRGNMLPKYYEVCIMNELQKMKKNGYQPDIVILEWTQMVFLSKQIKRLFPNCRIIASEHDVSYLSFYRKCKYETNKIKKKRKRNTYLSVKKEELEALSYCDMIFPHNDKDKNLLIEDEIPKDRLHTIVPYFDDYKNIKRKGDRKTILFYGAMGREENYQSAIWVIEQVLEKLKDEDIEFVVVGSNPHESLKQTAQLFNEKHNVAKVTITGFVEDVSKYFETAMCLAAPLLMGAGIKVKIIEAMSAGIPVLTNSIGIEGIEAVDGVDYLHCETATQYCEKIMDLKLEKIDTDKLSENSKNRIAEKFNMEESALEYIKILKQL